MTLIPSCGPFLVPAFFAYAFKEKEKLLGGTLIFFAGFLASFLPLALGITVLTSFVIQNTAAIYTVAGVLLLIFAVMALFGKTLVFGKPGKDTPSQRDPVHLFLFGVSFGLATSACTAPIFGAVLTVVAASGVGLGSILLLMAFALGMIIPLIILALIFDDVQPLRRCLFTRVYGFPLTNIISATLFGFLGILFLTSDAASPFVALGTRLGLLDFFYNANEKVLHWTAGLPQWANAAFLLTLTAFFIFVISRLRTKKK